ncbi:MAG: multifunctional CCA addition/repair protein [Thiotrichaceae bacterium]
MKIYLVGGAVRDKLLNLPIKDQDWVVTGATPKSMESLGYKPVGKDFPVFLHPDTNEEYALARTERKTSKGYHGFAFNASPEVTLKEDLLRRDLTINAIAEDENGKLYDYYGGREDLDNKILRHVSTAFAEDPVRILRVARFASRYAGLGFTIAEETMQLMREMVAAGEVDALVAERVWQETERALGEKHPEVYFTTLRECGALKVLFPDVDRLFGVPQVAKWHPEIDTGIHTMMVLHQATLLSDDPEVRFAALTHDLGKGTTPADILPSHHGHEDRSYDLVIKLCKQYRIPKRFTDLAKLTAKYHTHIHMAFDIKAKTMLKVLTACDIYRKPERFTQMLLACKADSRGRTGFEENTYEQLECYEEAADICRAVEVKDIIAKGFSGPHIKEELHKQRLSLLKPFLKAQTGTR